MDNFNSRAGGPRGGFRSKDRSFGAPVAMHKATCSECGNACEIPFVPSGGRPVYCSNCFESKRRPDDSPRPEHRNFDHPRVENFSNNQVLEQLVSLNSKMDRLLAALESKTSN